jgi:hypothetical protein
LRQPEAHVAVQTISKRCTIGVCQKKVPACRHGASLLLVLLRVLLLFSAR